MRGDMIIYIHSTSVGSWYLCCHIILTATVVNTSFINVVCNYNYL